MFHTVIAQIWSYLSILYMPTINNDHFLMNPCPLKNMKCFLFMIMMYGLHSLGSIDFFQKGIKVNYILCVRMCACPFMSSFSWSCISFILIFPEPSSFPSSLMYSVAKNVELRWLKWKSVTLLYCGFSYE